jgi:large subunit ribosomal protein L17
MRKQVFGRHLKRDTNERKALFKGLASSRVMHERMETIEEKAKAIKGHVEKMVTRANKSNSIQARLLLQAYLTNDALAKMFSEIAPRFINRPGGYTRIVKIGNRFSDDASMVIMEWVEKNNVEKKTAEKTTGSVVKKEKKIIASPKTTIAKTVKKTVVKKSVKKVESK